jgi:hypothetical protein
MPANGFPGVRLHDIRAGQATALLDRGVPIHVVAARCAHDPAVLLRWYAKRSKKSDNAAADIIGDILGGVFKRKSAGSCGKTVKVGESENR